MTRRALKPGGPSFRWALLLAVAAFLPQLGPAVSVGRGADFATVLSAGSLSLAFEASPEGPVLVTTASIGDTTLTSSVLRLQLPQGLACAGDPEIALGDLPTGCQRTARWALRVTAPVRQGRVVVVLEAAVDAAQARAHLFDEADALAPLRRWQGDDEIDRASRRTARATRWVNVTAAELASVGLLFLERYEPTSGLCVGLGPEAAPGEPDLVRLARAGAAHLAARRFAEATGDFDRALAIRLRPEDVTALGGIRAAVALGHALAEARLEPTGRLLRKLRRMLDRPESRPVARYVAYDLGVLSQRRDSKRAVGYFSRALEDNPCFFAARRGAGL